MLKAFFVVTDEYENTGIAVVSGDLEEAVQIARQSEFLPDGEPVDVWEIREADIDGLPVGIVDFIVGLRRSCYSWVEDICPLCQKVKRLVMSREDDLEGLICCSDCEESRIDELNWSELFTRWDLNIDGCFR